MTGLEPQTVLCQWSAAAGFKLRFNPADFQFLKKQRTKASDPNSNQKIAEVAQNHTDQPQVIGEKRAQPCINSDYAGNPNQVAQNSLPCGRNYSGSHPAYPEPGESAQHAKP